MVTGLVFSLLAATTAAFAVTEALKLERAPIGRARFTVTFFPACACSRATARLSLQLRKSDTLDATVLDADDDFVRTLLTESRRSPGRIVLRWDGRDDGGTVVPDGRYRLRVHLARAGRTIVVPKVVRVESGRP